MRKEIDNYIQFLLEKKRSPYNTRMSYERDLRQFREFLEDRGHQSLSMVKADDVKAYLKFQQENGMAASSISRGLAAIRSFFKYCLYNRLVSADPSMMITPPKQERKTPEILSLDEVNKLLEQPKLHNLKGKRDRAMLETLYATGIRVSELVSLSVDNVNVVKKTFSISDRKTRNLPVSDKAMTALTEYIQTARIQMIKARNEKILFVNCSGAPMTRQGFWKIVKEYAKAADVARDISPHMLRHSFAAHQLASGADLHRLKELMGHADIAATQIYLNTAAR